MKRAATITVFLLVTAASRVGAQTAASSPRVEVGGQLGALVATDTEYADAMFLWGPRVSVRLTDRLGVEFSTDLHTSSQSGYWGSYRSVSGIYHVAGTYTFRRAASSRTRVFATFGFLGTFSHLSASGYSYTSSNGTTITIPAQSYSTINGPQGVSGGVGVERRVNSHLAMRFSAEGLVGQELIFGARLLAGVTVPIGAYR